MKTKMLKHNDKLLAEFRKSLGWLLGMSPIVTMNAEPILTSWYTHESGRYARIWKNQEDERIQKATGQITSVTTWDAAAIAGNPMVGDQPLPVYSGVQEISLSNDSVYIKSTGLAHYTMGPWYVNEAKTSLFPSFPGNSAILYRFPRMVTYLKDYQSPKDVTNLGACGLTVDGVQIFNYSDGMSYNNAGVWNRDAFFNEGVTFDAGNAHQARESFHYHANPPALRHALADSVDYDASVVFTGLSSLGGQNPYVENPNGNHSPIIGWVNDGLPMYGPYGYSDPTNPQSRIRRMTSGYQMRDGSHSSYNIVTQGRNLLPQWVIHLKGLTNTTPDSSGPAVSATYPLGNYVEDYAYKGDLTDWNLYDGESIDGEFDATVHYDLNEFNARFCVTPEFPDGTWAYFTCIESDGTPIYPYNLGYAYFGDASLASGVTSITEDVEVLFHGGAAIPPSKQSIEFADDEITLTWNVIEGGKYRVDSSTDLWKWTNSTPEFVSSSDQYTASKSGFAANDQLFIRLVQTGISEYDTTEFSTSAPGGGGPGGGVATTISRVSPNQGTSGSTLVVQMTLNGGMLPPQNVTPLSVTIGTIAGSSIQYNGTIVTATFQFPSNLNGTLDITILFPPPPNAGPTLEIISPGGFSLN